MVMAVLPLAQTLMRLPAWPSARRIHASIHT